MQVVLFNVLSFLNLPSSLQVVLPTFGRDDVAGLEEEKKVYFTEHIFLEHHLDSWCPKKGPVRHFMELVCHGLSKNPHITVDMKIEHIIWFRDYFENKKQVLEETGAIPAEIGQ